MAIHKKPKGHQVIRTPAPDEENARVQNYGGSSLPPGQGGPLTLLGRNLRDSVEDPARDKILSQGSAGRGDEIPADDGDLAKLRTFNAEDLPADGSMQRRTVSDTSYPPTHGAVRQQDPSAAFGNVAARPQRVPHKLSANGMKALARGTARAAAQPVRKP
jgi:hypothetical protein